MEQYWMLKRMDRGNLTRCLKYYTPTRLFIRLVGSSGGHVKVRESLEERVFGAQFDKTGLHLTIDQTPVFDFPLDDYQKGFSLAYERIKDGVFVMLPTGFDPYDPQLPEPRTSVLRSVLDDHLLEITFAGRVHLAFHSWWQEPHWKYWKVVAPPKE